MLPFRLLFQAIELVVYGAAARLGGFSDEWPDDEDPLDR